MYTVLNMGWLPSDWLKLSRKEKSFVIASILLKIDEEKKQMNKAKQTQRKGRRK